jgi:hypothetical protein
MQQKLASGLPSRSWYAVRKKCHFCRRVITKGEEIISFGGGSSGETAREMHRVCLDNWLHEHPPLPDAVVKISSAEEIEAEFVKLQRRLKAQARKARQKTLDKS